MIHQGEEGYLRITDQMMKVFCHLAPTTNGAIQKFVHVQNKHECKSHDDLLVSQVLVAQDTDPDFLDTNGLPQQILVPGNLTKVSMSS